MTFLELRVQGRKVVISHLDFSLSRPSLPLSSQAQEKHTINHRILETGADGGGGGGEAARLCLAEQKAQSAKENVSVFKLRGMLNAWELILKET